MKNIEEINSARDYQSSVSLSSYDTVKLVAQNIAYIKRTNHYMRTLTNIESNKSLLDRIYNITKKLKEHY